MTADKESASASSGKDPVKKWLLITFVFLLLMAFLSALGDFFVRVFLVCALFSGWKMVRSWLDSRYGKRTSEYSRFYKRPSGNTSYSSSFDNAGKLHRSVTLSWSSIRKVIGVVFVFFIFGLLIFAVLLFFPDDSVAEIYYANGNQFYEEQQYDSAYRQYRMALSARPEYPEALFAYGNVLYTRNYPDSSIYYYDKALELNADFDDAKYNKAWVYYQQRKYDQSIEQLETLLEGSPFYFAAMQLLGDNYFVKDNYEEALEWYEQAYSNGMRDGFFCERLAYIYDTRNNREKAIELYKEGVSYDNTLKYSFTRLGELLPGQEGEEYRKRVLELQ